MKLITFSGVDGSGKSTQLKLLKEKLEQAGKKIFYFHAIEFSLANRLARISKGEKEFVPGSEKASTKASWSSLQLRKLFLLIDIVRFKSLMRKLAHENYDYVLSDRYFYDSVINILYLSKSTDVCHPELAEGSSSTESDSSNLTKTTPSLFVENFIPYPDFAFYFQITAEEIMKRDRVPEQGIEYLKEKIALFEQKKEALRLLSIDASESQTTITEKLLTYLNL